MLASALASGCASASYDETGFLPYDPDQTVGRVYFYVDMPIEVACPYAQSVDPDHPSAPYAYAGMYARTTPGYFDRDRMLSAIGWLIMSTEIHIPIETQEAVENPPYGLQWRVRRETLVGLPYARDALSRVEAQFESMMTPTDSAPDRPRDFRDECDLPPRGEVLLERWLEER